MKANRSQTLIRIGSVLNWVLPVLAYLTLLVVRIPYTSTAFFRFYSAPLFLLVLTVYFLLFRFAGKFSWVAGFLFTMALFSLALSYMWNSGFSDNGILGGLLPYKDGYHYYNGARLLSIGQLLPGYSVQAAERPLFPGFLSVVLALTGDNLRWTLAMLVGLAGVSSYLSAGYVYRHLGGLAASAYLTLLFFYIQPYIGFSLTEMLGFVFGCLGMVLLWRAAERRAFGVLVFAIFVLMVGVSARAGAFFVFPMLALWAGWLYRDGARYSLRMAGLTLAVVVLAYLSLNTFFARLMVEPDNQTFGNFTYMIYGQIEGGAGWHKAIEDLGTRDPGIVLRAALGNFLDHPLSLGIGSAKAYRDFLFPGEPGIFSFHSPLRSNWLSVLLWWIFLALMVWGFVRSLRQIASPAFSLWAACFLGILLSIPFLPPVDGGRRFYASTMPFVFILPAVAAARLLPKRQEPSAFPEVLGAVQATALLLLASTVVVSVLLQNLSRAPSFPVPECPPEQAPFAVRLDPGSYVDLVPEGGGACGSAPEICLQDFQANGTEKTIDDFYQELLRQSEALGTTSRIFTADDLIDGRFYYYLGAASELRTDAANRVLTGCAQVIEITTQTRPTIYKIESIQSAPGEP